AYALFAPPPAPADSRIDGLTNGAHQAAAKSHFVYPPTDDKDAPTAYKLVLELETLDGELGPLARDAASRLRTEFADTLARLGDRYWELDGGAAFATDYYAQALMFAPDHSTA